MQFFLQKKLTLPVIYFFATVIWKLKSNNGECTWDKSKTIPRAYSTEPYELVNLNVLV